MAGEKTIAAPDEKASDRGLRADAARNRRTLLDAAAVALAREGVEVSVSSIAETAGLGKATVFRRFPTKDDLVAAVVEDRFDQFIAAGERLVDTGAPGALREFLTAGAELLAGNHGLCEALYGLADRDEVRTVIDRVLDITRALLRAAQTRDDVRADVTAEDLLLLMRGIAQTARPLQAARPELWRRYLDLAWEGLEARRAQALSAPPPAFPRLRPAAEEP